MRRLSTALSLVRGMRRCIAAIASAAVYDPDEYKCQHRLSEGKKQVLWIGGGHWHNTLQTAAILRRVLEGVGPYHVTYTEETSVFTRLARYDVVLLNGMLDSFGPQEEESLLDTIFAGKPLLVLHAASACFRKSLAAERIDPPAEHPRFYKMLGGYVHWHSPFGPIHARVTSPDHPITRGIRHFTIEDELFLFRDLQPDNKVLLAAEFEGRHCPLAWTRCWGEGRVFHLALGHSAKAANNAAFQRLITQGVDWLTHKNSPDT